MAKDGGYLIVEPQGYERVQSDPIAAKYLRPYIGSRELLHGGSRWCLWLEDAAPQDLSRSPVLREQVEAVRAFRLGAKAPSTNDFASIPHLFTQRAAQRTTFVCIPRVSSENRPYLPCAYLDPDVIASDANYQVQDPDGLQFAILSSAMLLTWQKTIGGRLESRIRFAVRTVWNNFPLPQLTREQHEGLVTAGKTVLAARNQNPARSLAQHYSATGLEQELAAAHLELDRQVDALFGVGTNPAEGERQQSLFEAYLSLVPSPSLLD